jgi:lysozyme
VGWVWRRLPRALAVAVAVSTVIIVVPAVSATARDKVLGIDVSKYQHRIGWRQVASTRVRFAILRASLGNSYVDPRYRRNLTRATRHGLAVGAYHYAKPGHARWDARAEANQFLQVARNAPGDVVPVLDIEDSGGLNRRQLWRWARRWLNRVEEETGVRPMIYSGNYFWERYMGNTSWFGREGYPHWVAHWDVRRPDVPGRRWGGRGWTFWQWSATGRVPGIRGPVDLDWFGGKDLSRGTIASLAVAGPDDGTIVGPRIECGGGPSRCDRLADPGATIELRVRPANGARFVRWTGACAAAGARPTCRISATGRLEVSAVFDRRPVGWRDTALLAIGGADGGCTSFAPRCAIAALLSGRLGERLADVLPPGHALARLVAGAASPSEADRRSPGKP